MKTFKDRMEEYTKKYDLSTAIDKALTNTLHRKYKNASLLDNRIERIFGSMNGLFITLTFTDLSLTKLSKETRRRYVMKWCSEYLYEYVGNIDFGDENGREHYHVCGIMKDKLDNKTWLYGSINFKRMYNKSPKIREYIRKLKNHAIKETAGKVFYSRLYKSCVIEYTYEETLEMAKNYKSKKTFVYQGGIK